MGHVELNHFKSSSDAHLMDLFFSSGPSAILGLYGKAQFSQENEADLFSAKSFALLSLNPSIVGQALLEITYGPSDESVSVFYSHPLAQARKEAVDKFVPSLSVASQHISVPAWLRFELSCKTGDL